MRAYHYKHPFINLPYSALPGFWSTTDTLENTDLGSENIIDGVHTYLAKYYLDFWYCGIFGINFLWG